MRETKQILKEKINMKTFNIKLPYLGILFLLLLLIPEAKGQDSIRFQPRLIDSNKYIHTVVYDSVYGSFHTEIYKAPKDTFIEYSENEWYNEYRREFRDSTQYYKNIEWFVELWDKYEQKCFNDSIEDCGYHFVEDENWNGMSVGHNEFNCIWIHSTPTMYGFMEYLKNKLKCN